MSFFQFSVRYLFAQCTPFRQMIDLGYAEFVDGSDMVPARDAGTTGFAAPEAHDRNIKQLDGLKVKSRTL